MGEVITVGLDLAKQVFQAHGADASGGVVFRKKLRRDQLLLFFAKLPRCVVAMEACASAHYWAREIDMTKASYVASRRSPPFEALPLAPSADRPSLRRSETAQSAAKPNIHRQ